MLIKEAAHKVKRKHKDAFLWVGDLSVRKGGPIEHHGSHQNGRDVDLLFYATDKEGKAVANDKFTPFDSNGISTDPPLMYKFDVARNWSLVRALLESNRAQVQWIFVADYLKKLLIDHARKIGANRSVINQAQSVLHQPQGKLHWDHFHVRIYCPSSDLPQCNDIGPQWAWAN